MQAHPTKFIAEVKPNTRGDFFQLAQGFGNGGGLHLHHLTLQLRKKRVQVPGELQRDHAQTWPATAARARSGANVRRGARLQGSPMCLNLLLLGLATSEAWGQETEPTGVLPRESELGAQGADQAGELQPPRLLNRLDVPWPADVPYTQGATRIGFELVIDEEGRVENIRGLTGPESFWAAAEALIAAARFEPARDAGGPVAVTIPLILELRPPPIVAEGRLLLSGGSSVAVAGATLELGGQEATTDAEGRFEFRGLPPGEYALTTRAAGLRTDPVVVSVVEGSAAVIALWARPNSVGDGIVATYRKGRPEVGRRTLSAEELRNTPGTLGDPLRAVANLPGVVRSPLEMGWMLVRGGDPRDTAVYVDGVRLPLVYHLGGFTSVLHPAFIDRVEFLPGGGGVRYGRATAGTIDLVTRGREPAAEARAGANLVFASGYANIPWPNRDDITLSASFRRSYLDAVLSPFLPEESRGAIPRFWDWQGRVDIGPDSSVSLFGFADTIDVGDSGGGIATISVATQRVHGRTRVPLGARELVLHPYLSVESISFELEEWTSSSERLNAGGGLRAEIPDDGERFWGWSAGVDLDAFSATLRTNQLSRVEPVFMPDPYAEVRIGKQQQTSAIAGLRVDTLLAGDHEARVGLSPRLMLHHAITSNARIGLEAGLYHEAPPWELLLGPPEGAVLALDESINLAANAGWGRGPISLNLDVWTRVITRTTRMEADGSLDQGDGLAVGTDLFVDLRLGRLSAMAKYGLSSSLRRDDVEDSFVPSPYDQPHSVGLVAAYDLGRAWNLGARWRFSSGFPVPNGGVEAFDVLTLQTFALDPESGRLDDFHALDLKISKRFMFRKWRLDAYLDVQNVYNRRVAEPVITGFTDVVFDGYGYGLTTLPIFGVEGQWGGDPRRP